MLKETTGFIFQSVSVGSIPNVANKFKFCVVVSTGEWMGDGRVFGGRQWGGGVNERLTVKCSCSCVFLP